MASAKPRLSLKGRGLQLLAQREHSRSELRRKLMAHARAAAVAQAAEASAATFDGTGDVLGGAVHGAADEPVDPTAQVEAVLDWLQAQHYLSDERFVDSRLHLRATRYGNLRIRQELAQHGVSLSEAAARELKDSELGRAREVWARKFGQPAQDAAGRARQARFLAARGFSSDVVRRVVLGRGGGGDDGDGEA